MRLFITLNVTAAAIFTVRRQPGSPQETAALQWAESVYCGIFFGADEWAEFAVVIQCEAEILVDIHQALLLAAGFEQFSGSAGRGQKAMRCFRQQAVALGGRQL